MSLEYLKAIFLFIRCSVVSKVKHDFDNAVMECFERVGFGYNIFYFVNHHKSRVFRMNTVCLIHLLKCTTRFSFLFVILEGLYVCVKIWRSNICLWIRLTQDYSIMTDILLKYY